MKKFLIPVAVIASVVLLLAFIRPDANPGEVMMIRGIIVVTGTKDASTIKIYKGAETIEKIELGKINDTQTFDAGMNKIMETVNKYTSDGYEVISSTEFGGPATVILNFMIKKQR